MTSADQSPDAGDYVRAARQRDQEQDELHAQDEPLSEEDAVLADARLRAALGL